jgi:hypothetical protein
MGMLGALVAGAAGGYADARGEQLKREEDFNYKQALMNAQVEKELMLKKAGYELDDQHAEQQRQKNAQTMRDIEQEYDSNVASQPGGYDPNDPEGMGKRKFSELNISEQSMERGKGLLARGDTEAAKEQIGIAAAMAKADGKKHTLKAGEILVDENGNTLYEAPKEAGKIEYKTAGNTLFVLQDGKVVQKLEGGARTSIVKHQGREGDGSGGGGKEPAAVTTMKFKINALKNSGLTEQEANLVVAGGGLKRGDAAKIVANMDSFDKKRAYPDKSDQEIIDMLVGNTMPNEEKPKAAAPKYSGDFRKTFDSIVPPK